MYWRSNLGMTYLQHDIAGITYFTVPAFSETGLVVHAFSGRRGGVSVGSFESLNLGMFTSDIPDRVLENRKRLGGILDVDPSCFVAAHQVHGDHVLRIDAADKGRGAIYKETVIPDTDALITGAKGVPLMAFFADCVPVILLDPVNEAIGLAHAGWKGTVAGIAAKTVQEMGTAFGTKPEKLLAAIGPSIGPCHYQVDEPVNAKVKEAFPDQWSELLSGFTPDGHAWLNLWAANACKLRQAGVLERNISVTGLCTYCKPDVFFSHRHGMAGRQAAVIMLKS